MAAGVAAGALIALAAFAVKKLIAAISRLATAGFDADHANWWMLLLGIASITLSASVVRKIVRMPLEHATERMKADLAAGKAPLPARLIVAPISVNALTLGLGGSAGAEGPIAYTGAAIASRMARWCGLTREQAVLFLACGAGAGIAAIFKAPLGGVFFTIEVLGFELSLAGVILLTVMCLTAGLGAFALGGLRPDVVFTAAEAFDWRWCLPVVVLGLWCGIYSAYYMWTGRKVEQGLTAVNRPLHRNLLAGGTLGVLLFLFPSLYGEGYGVLAQVLNGDVGVVTQGTFAHGLSGTPLFAAVLAGILLVKGVATYATNSGGGVAGDFAPTIFAGGMAGALFVLGATAIPGLESMPQGDFILLGMAGVMAGAIKAPLMAIFIVAEMTQSVQLLLPLCIVSAISYFTASSLKFSKTKC